jgi:hypothetical protein
MFVFLAFHQLGWSTKDDSDRTKNDIKYFSFDTASQTKSQVANSLWDLMG